MTYVKKMRLKGFKSFAGPLEFDFGKNFNCILGPNGSGKSCSYDTVIVLSDGSEVKIGNLIEEKLKSAKIIKNLKDGIYCESKDSIKVISLNKDSMKSEEKEISKFIRRKGEKHLYEITTRTGKKIKTTGCHPVVVFKEGKIKSSLVRDLNESDLIASPRIIYSKGNKFDCEISYLLGCLIGDGSVQKNNIRFINQDKELLESVKSIVYDKFAIKPNQIYKKQNTFDLRYTDKNFVEFILSFFDKGKINSETKSISNKFLKSDLSSVSSLIAGLYDTDSSIRKDLDTIEYCSKSKKLVNQLQRLLLRFGIVSIKKERLCCAVNTKKKIKRKYYYLYITGMGNLIRFYENIPLKCIHKKEILFNRIKNIKKSNPNIDLLPKETNILIKKAVNLLGIKCKPLRKKYAKLVAYIENRCKPTRTGLNEIIPLLSEKLLDIYSTSLDLKEEQINLVEAMDLIGLSGSQVGQQIGMCKQNIRVNWATNKFQAKKKNLSNFFNFIQSSISSRLFELKEIMNTLCNLANSDIFWDEIYSIEKVRGEKYVYDLTIPDNHNFIGDGVFVHNSNVMDAMVFVLGEISAKSMRAQKSANLIFNGGKKGSAAKEAEVSIYFDNSKKKFPYDAKEVKISRIVRNNGNSIYKINDETRTRQEVKELLSKARIDVSGHNIVLQGDIIHFMEMKSEERRKIIEEVSGISIYEEKKNQSMNELNKVEQKLNEVGIVMKEREVHLRELKKDRDHALKYKEYEQKVKENKATFLYIQIKDKNKSKEDIEKRIAKEQSDIDRLNKKVSEFKEKINSNKDNLKNLNNLIEQKGEKEQIVLQREIELLKTKFATDSVRLEGMKNEINKLKSRKSNILKEREEISSRIVKLEAKKKELEKEMSSVSHEEKDIVFKIESYKKKHSLYDSVENLDSEIQKKQQQLFDLKDKKQELSLNAEQIRGEIRQIDALLGMENNPKIKGFVNDLKNVEKDLENELAKLSVSNSRLVKNNNLLNEQNIEYSRLNERQVSLGVYNSSINKILKMKKSGVYGTVSQLGKVDPKNALALEVSAGAKIKSIVVSNDKIAVDCIKELKKSHMGVVTFLPLNKIKARTISPNTKELLGKEGVIGLATELIKYDSKFVDIFSYVFGGTLIVKNDSVARRLGIGRARMVTLDGDLFEVSGSITGGYRRKSGSFKEVGLDAKINSIEREINSLKQNIHTLNTDIAKSEESCRKFREVKAILEAELLKIQKTTEIKDLDKLKQNKIKLNSDLKEIEKNIKVIDKDLQIVLNYLDKLRAKRQKMSSIDGSVKGGLQTLENMRLELSNKLVGLQSDIKNLVTQIFTIHKPELNKVSRIIKENEKEFSKFSSSIVELEEGLKKAKEDLKAKEIEEKKFHSEYKNLFVKRNKISEEISKLENNISKEEYKLRQIEGRINEINLKRAKIIGELESLQEEFKKFSSERIRRNISTEDLKAEIYRCERFLRNMGNVNLRSLEVYEQVSEEYGKLNKKIEQLRLEKEDVLKMMIEIEKNKKKLFMKAFNIINENFKNIFITLFAKGDAYLELENKEDPFAEGIDIKVRLIGNKFLDIKSLSGGEKTLTALSFIFAIQEYNPASFYLLDEVDAALDKSNSALLSKLVRKYSENAQYILISHNDNLITEADQIYGISMQKNGVSKVVSLKI